MTAHSELKRPFDVSRSFDECVNILWQHATIDETFEDIEDFVEREWLIAREYGIPEHLICKFIMSRVSKKSVSRRYRPRPRTFILR